MPCVVKDDEHYEQIIDDPCNPNEHQPTEAHDSNCIKKLIEVSSTTMYNYVHEENVFTNKGEVGLFNLFCNDSIKNSVFEWTNKGTEALCSPYRTTKHDLGLFTDIEFAMSLNPLPDIKDHWSSKIFVGNSVFSTFQSRNAHLDTRHNVEFHPVFPMVWITRWIHCIIPNIL